MEIRGKRVLVLGGAGLVGMAVCRKMFQDQPEEIILLSLTEKETKDACEQLSKTTDIRITPVWGNMFVREELKDLSWNAIFGDPGTRSTFIHDILDDMDEEILRSAYVYKVIDMYRPHIVIDAVNTATGVAYQDVFNANYRVRRELEKAKNKGELTGTLVEEVEKLMCSLYVPQLIRHIQVLYEAMKRVKTSIYIKVGTSGTGGMGLNIPYTHSEEKPSRMLLSKSSVAGAHTLLLFLMARTPGGPITKEIKPTAAIAWKRIAHGEIRRKGRPVQLFDCPPEQGVTLDGTLKLGGNQEWVDMGETLKSAYIDAGENGIFSVGEFESITSSQQMEFITPEEIANDVVYEIKGGNSGHDIVNALDNATMGPTYRAGILRHNAIGQMKEIAEEHGCDSISFQQIGPLVSKLLYEVHILSKICPTMDELRYKDTIELSKAAEELVKADARLRAETLSVGVPILLSDGKTLLRGPEITVPPGKGAEELDITPENVDKWAADGWVDLRIENIKLWQERVNRIYAEMDHIPEDDSSSQFVRNRRFWLRHDEVVVGKIVGWVLSTEYEGARMKA
jgi:hypothetical protein